MRKKSMVVRFPIDAKEGFKKKKDVIQEILRKEGKKNKVYLTDTLRYFAQKPILLYHDEVVDFFSTHKKCKQHKRILV